MKTKIFYIIFFMVAVPGWVVAQHADTLPTVKVLSGADQKLKVAVMPLQQLNKSDLLQLNSLSVADAVKNFSGVLVKDYGGLGGLKTVSVRSLGAAHTAVMYDGVMLSDAQAGQVDLGKISLENLEKISFYNAQPNDILQPAQAFASGAVLQLQTDNRFLLQQKKWGLDAGIQVGSFDFIRANLTAKHRINRRLFHSVHSEINRSNGAYPFQSYEIQSNTDKRQNGDIQSARFDYDLRYRSNDSNQVMFKSGYFMSDRGLPGAVILYNTINGDRLNDKNFYVHAQWNRYLTNKTRMLLNARYDYQYTGYLDPEFANAQGKLIHDFHQKRYYASGSVKHELSKHFSLSWSGDYFIQQLTRTDEFAQGFATPTRYTLLNNLAAIAKLSKFVLQGSLLYSHVHNQVEQGAAAPNRNEFSPTIAVGFAPDAGSALRLRAFYKNIFRIPSFNDLYYTLIGNTALNPEYVKQYNLGATYTIIPKKIFNTVLITTDIYYNAITDKILAVPRQNLFQWSMMNVGKVEVKGVDAAIYLDLKHWGNLGLNARFSYSFQQAINKADKNSSQYNTQLPYTPKHSGSVQVDAEYKKLSVGINVLFSGYRYRQGDPIPDNYLPQWVTQDVVLRYALKGSATSRYRLSAGVSNLFNKQYEIVRYYPMPGIHYKVGIHIHI